MKESFGSRLICASVIIFSCTALSITGFSQTPDKGKPSGDYSYFRGGRISVVPSSHQDIAWMDSIGKCIEFRDEKMITPVLARLKASTDFRFSVEDGLSLREYLVRHPDAYNDILKYTQEGRLEWGATYKQPYESMYDGEALIRQAYLGRKWMKKTLPGCDFRVYWNEDVPGRALQMPQILAKSGIPYMQFSRHQPGIYRWYSPDGSYITCYTPGQYDEVGIPVREAATDVKKLTRAFTVLLTEWNDYYRANKLNPEFQFLYSHDFATPPDYDAFFRDWNGKAERLGKPTINYSTATGWFDAVTKGNPSFEKIQGERPDVWLYIHGPSHQRALKASREGSRLLTAAEKFATFDALEAGSFKAYPQDVFTRAWENAIYPDHGWGGKHGDMTDRTFRTSFETARDLAADILGKSMKNIASRINLSKEALPIVVFNPLSWERTDLVKFSLDVEGAQSTRYRLTDQSGKNIPYQLISEHNIAGRRDEVLTLLFVAEKVPSVGYSTYYLTPGDPEPAEHPAANNALHYENSFFRVEFSAGGIKSLFDKELKTEVFNTEKFLGAELFTMQSVGNGAGEFSDVQQPTMEGFARMNQYGQPWALVSEGPVRDIYEFKKEIEHVTVVEQVIFYKTIKRIDIHVELNGFDGERYREFRLAFPVSKAQKDVAYEVPMGVVRVGKDEIAGAAGFSKVSQVYSTPCAQVHPREVQDWFSASDGKTGLTISSDVAVFDWIDPTENPAGYVILQPVLLASRKSCHGEGNYYLQPGNHEFTFSLYSHTGDWHSSFRSGTQSNQPLKAVTVTPVSGASMPETLSFISAENSNLILSTVKKCDDDNSVIVRCYDIEGIESTARLTTSLPFTGAELTNMIEEEGRPLPGQGKTLGLTIGKNSIETIKLHVK